MCQIMKDMNENLLNYNDRRFLKQIGVDPEPTDFQVMEDLIRAPPQYLPQVVYLTQEAANQIVEQYGELTMETFAIWMGWRIE